MEERRKFSRLQTKEKAFLNETDAGSAKGSIVDISPGGMRIILDTQASPGTAISGQFKILPTLGPFYVKGEVAWVKPAKEQAGFEVGIKFNKISAAPL
jgi:hypothetical protein